ncbi:V-type ATP synthase subunit D, partial [Candidatus Margulisiibacteriota bacterium]
MISSRVGLKDKLDGLIQRILAIVKAHRRLSRKLEQDLIEVFQELALSSAQISPPALLAATLLPSSSISVDISLKNIMGVKIPKYELKSSGEPVSYGFSDTPAELDRALTRFKEILPELVKLAEHNKAILVIARQIIEIKRR